MKDAYIYYGLYKGKSFVSRAIKFMKWEKESHASGIYPPTILHNGRAVWGEIVEAWHKPFPRGKVHKRHYRDGHTPGTPIDIYRVVCTKEEQEIFYNFLEAQEGKYYDFGGIFGFLARSKTENPNKWFCSELVFAAAKEAGINLLNNIEAHKVSPGTISLTPLAEFVETIKT